MSLSKTIIKNALSNYTGIFVGALVGLFISPFVVHHLGNTGYGIWALFQSVFGYFGLLDMGLGVSVVKYISQFKAKNDQKSINTFGSTIFFIYLLLGIAALVLSFAFVPFVTKIFTIPAAYKHIAVYAVIISGLTTGVLFPAGFLLGSLAANQRYDLTNIVAIARYLIYAVSVVLLLKHGFGLLSLFVLNLVLTTLTLLVTYYMVVFKYKFVRLKLRLFKLGMLKMAYKYSVFVFLNNVAGQAVSSAGTLIIGVMLAVKFVTFYALAFKISSIITQSISAIVYITLPVFSELWAINDKEKIRFTYLEITKAIVLIALPVSMVVALFSESIMNVWIGPGYHLAALALILIAIVSFIHYIGGYITGILLFGIGKHKVLSIANAIAAVVDIVLAVVLTKWIAAKYGEGYGVLGIPIALGLSTILVSIFFLPWYVNKIIELPNRQYLKNLVRPVLFIIPAVILALLIKRFYEPHSMIIFVVESAVIGFTYWGLYYLFGLTKEEKARYMGYAKQFSKGKGSRLNI